MVTVYLLFSGTNSEASLILFNGKVGSPTFIRRSSYSAIVAIIAFYVTPSVTSKSLFSRVT